MTELSPATQAIMNSAGRRYAINGSLQDGIATALRALASNAFVRLTIKGVEDSGPTRIVFVGDINAIAAELDGDKKAAEADLIAKAAPFPETCNRRLDKFMSVANDQLEVLAEIFSETDRADKISLHCDPATRTVTIRYEDLEDGWFNDLCNLRSSLNS